MASWSDGQWDQVGFALLFAPMYNFLTVKRLAVDAETSLCVFFLVCCRKDRRQFGDEEICGRA